MAFSSPLQRRRSSTADWSDPPRDVMCTILEKLNQEEILGKAHNVCKNWREISKTPSLWRSIETRGFRGNSRRKTTMARKAVDYSCGQLIEFRFEGECGIKLLRYMAQRAGGLRILEVSCSISITAESVTKAVKKLPLLEQLTIGYRWFSEEEIETIGTCCPRLTHLVFENTSLVYGCILPRTSPWKFCDKEALVFGRSMPGLRVLQIYGQTLNSSGLQAILDGCPNLVSLRLLIRGSCDWELTMPKSYSSQMEKVHFTQLIKWY